MALKDIFNFLWNGKSPKNKTHFEQYVDDFYDGKAVTTFGTTSQLKLSAVYRCVEILSNSIGKLPFTIIDTNTQVKAGDRPSKRLKYLLNVAPNPNMTSFVFHKLMETNRLLTGNAYAIIKTNSTGFIESLTPINSDFATVNTLLSGEIVYDITDKDKNTKRYLQDEVLHIKGISVNGIVGQSVLTYARGVTDNATLQEQHANNVYKRGGRPIDILTPDKDVQLSYIKVNAQGKPDPNGTSHYELIDEQWDKINGSDTVARRPAILPKGMSYTPIPQISMRDLAFIEAKEISIADIARFFGVPLYKLFAGKESYQSNEQNGIAYVTDTLVPIVTQYEQEYTNKTLSDDQKYGGVSVKANLNNEMRGDLRTRSEWHKSMFEHGVSSINDIRALEDMEGIPDGDKHYVSLNYAPIDKHADWWDERVKQANDSHLGQGQQQNTQGGTTQQ